MRLPDADLSFNLAAARQLDPATRPTFIDRVTEIPGASGPRSRRLRPHRPCRAGRARDAAGGDAGHAALGTAVTRVTPHWARRRR